MKGMIGAGAVALMTGMALAGFPSVACAEWIPGPWPVLREYDGDHLLRIALPLGGIGTGTVSLGGRGELRDWEVMNRPAKGYCGTGEPNDAPFFAVATKSAKGPRLCRMAAGPLYDCELLHCEGQPVPNHGLPRFSKATFRAAYPFGEAVLTDDALPIRLTVRGFNPLVSDDVASSSLPLAALFYEVENLSDVEQEVSVCGRMRNFIGADGSKRRYDTKGFTVYQGACSNENAFVETNGLRGIAFSSKGVSKRDLAWGTMALVTTAPTGVTQTVRGGGILSFWDDFSDDGEISDVTERFRDDPTAALCVKRTVPPRGKTTFAFYLTWSFPNRQVWNVKNRRFRNFYTKRNSSALAAAVRIIPQMPELERQTREFVESILSSEAPEVLQEAALFNLSVLRSQTVFRLEDGHLLGWEGVFDSEGSCAGSCTHVWNYDDATPCLFPSLARTMRDVEFNLSTLTNGQMAFRTPFPINRPLPEDKPAADGQMGCIVKAYRDWKRFGDDKWLERYWPKVKAALSFAWSRDGVWNWDVEGDGVMEGRQHNTMDVDYYGPNPQMQFWYIAALTAGAEMAKAMGDGEFEAKCRRMASEGAKFADGKMFNGEYYEQLLPKDRDLKEQLGCGCLVDQLVGLTTATLCGLETPVDPVHRKKAIESVWRYNRRADMAGEFRHMRSYAFRNEAGLLMATWPKGGREKLPFPYFTEVMTGFEYVAATEMIFQGMRDEALQVVRDVRARHDGAKRNPFSEPECGHHYARSLASWGTFRAWLEAK